MPRAVIVMVKGPRPGAVKTRLIPAIGAAQAAGLYRAFLGDVLESVAAVPAERFVFVHPAEAQEPAEAHEWFRELAGPRFHVRAQSGDSLPERMIAAFAELFADRFSPIVMRNSDSPTLPASRLLEAFDALEAGADLVLGPDFGGGYYLAGLREPRPDLFRGVAMSAETSASVFAETARRARLYRLKTRELPPCLDVDTPADLERLREEIGSASPADVAACERTAAFLAMMRVTSGNKFAPRHGVP